MIKILVWKILNANNNKWYRKNKNKNIRLEIIYNELKNHKHEYYQNKALKCFVYNINCKKKMSYYDINFKITFMLEKIFRVKQLAFNFW